MELLLALFVGILWLVAVLGTYDRLGKLIKLTKEQNKLLAWSNRVALIPHGKGPLDPQEMELAIGK